MVKKYIDEKEWISRLENELKETTNEQRRTYLNIWINAIKCQPTLDEKEIIRKTVERIVEKLEQQEKQYNERAKKFAEALHSWEERRNYGKACSYAHAIEIVKEECGISE